MSSKARNWIIGIALSASAAFVGIQTTGVFTPAQPTAEFIPPGNCAYSWANYDAPELTEKVDAEVKALNSSATAKATLYGEDCIHEDGSKTFGVMETYFTVRLTVDDLSKHEEFGDWIKAVMQVVTEIPSEEIQGKYGFVEFWFEKNNSENIVFRVSIPAYIDEANNKTGIELFNMYYLP